MNLFRFFILVGVIFSPSFASADCDSELFNALRTKYSMSQDQTLAETVFKLVCNKSSSDKNWSGQYNATSVAYGNKSSAEACMKNDTTFFSRNKIQIGLSFIPDEAISGCFGGLSFSATQTPDGKTVSVSAAYKSPGSGILATINNITWMPELAMNCDSTGWLGTALIPGGKRFSCNRNTNDDVVFTLSTSEGDRQFTVQRTPIIKRIPITWDYDVLRVGGKHNHTVCRNQFNEFVGGRHNCVTDKTCNSRPAIIHMCQLRYGSEYITVDGERITTESH